MHLQKVVPNFMCQAGDPSGTKSIIGLYQFVNYKNLVKCMYVFSNSYIFLIALVCIMNYCELQMLGRHRNWHGW